MFSCNKKMLFLGLLLSLSQGAFAAAAKIVLPGQKQMTENQVQKIENQVPKPVSFVEAVQNGQPTGLPEEKEKYADKVLKDDISFFGLCGRGVLKSIVFGALLAGTDINFNLAYAGTALADEALIAAGLFKDSKVIRAHKDATWWQWFKAQDGILSGLPSDYSEHAQAPLGRMTRSFWLPVVAVFSAFKFHSTELDKLTAVFGCAVSYIVAELVRQKMITPEESPRMANVVAILLAGSMNEVIKKVA